MDDNVREAIALLNDATEKGVMLISHLKEYIQMKNNADDYCNLRGYYDEPIPIDFVVAYEDFVNVYQAISKIIWRGSE